MGNDIRNITRTLWELYPITGMYGSRASLYGDGLKDKIINKEEYDAAKEYYGDLWYYTGD